MTPLARSLFMGKAEDRDGLSKISGELLECQFFEISDVFDLANDLAWDVAYGVSEFSTEDLFLPSEPCFIEWHNGRQRTGWLLRRRGAQISGQMIFGTTKDWIADGGAFELFSELKAGPVVHKAEALLAPPDDPDGAPSTARLYLQERAFLAIALGMINTPRIIGRRQHMPDARLERALLKHRRPIGRFPLGAWSEIMLRVSPPKDASGEPSREAHLTGAKAMHFCRAHLRLRLGRVEVVRGHWRGDASLGVRRSRYKVTN